MKNNKILKYTINGENIVIKYPNKEVEVLEYSKELELSVLKEVKSNINNTLNKLRNEIDYKNAFTTIGLSTGVGGISSAIIFSNSMSFDFASLIYSITGIYFGVAINEVYKICKNKIKQKSLINKKDKINNKIINIEKEVKNKKEENICDSQFSYEKYYSNDCSRVCNNNLSGAKKRVLKR